MKQNSIEILAPAGSFDSLIAAVRSGADAVYLGASSFSARANAHNFDNSELKQAADYCHARGVKLYLAVNTLLRQDELPAALDLVRYACSLPVDAVIIQDPGLIWMLRVCCPDLHLNASTQMSIHTPAGAQLLARLGFSRVVLARELSLSEIREISDKTQDSPIELESFVHGALCMSVSGQCYFSAMLGSRSGNRGLCAQTCRLPFSAPGGTGHDLSLKDLSMISRLGDLMDAGVCSAKIEGRMKRPEYVAAATAACRHAADGEEIPPVLTHDLAAVFSRSGFTTGYPDGKLGRDMFGVRSKEDVTGATNEVFANLRALYQKEPSRVPVDFSLSIQPNQPVTLCAADPDGRRAEVHGDVPQTAVHRAIDSDRCREQLSKTGGTPFFARSVSCTIAEGLSVPASALNALRRDALTLLEQQRARRDPIPFAAAEIPGSAYYPTAPMKLRARFADPSVIPDLAARCELVYIPLSAPIEVFRGLRERGIPAAAEIPRALFGREESAARKLQILRDEGFLDCRAGNLGAAALAVSLGMRVHGAFSLNVMNTPALRWYQEIGLADTELSFELTLAQAAALGGDLPRGLVIYGRLPLMLCRNCPAANSPKGCLHCIKPPELTDRRGAKFPIECGKSYVEVLNSVPLYLADRFVEIKGQDFGVLHFTVENSVEIVETLSRYLDPAHAGKPDFSFTRGLYYRGVE